MSDLESILKKGKVLGDELDHLEAKLNNDKKEAELELEMGNFQRDELLRKKKREIEANRSRLEIESLLLKAKENELKIKVATSLATSSSSDEKVKKTSTPSSLKPKKKKKGRSDPKQPTLGCHMFTKKKKNADGSVDLTALDTIKISLE